MPRRLGIGVVPVEGESFPSWVDRMAVRMRTGPGRVVRELGVELLPGNWGAVKPLNYGISMSRRDLDAVHAATGVVPETVSGMLLSVYDGTVLDLSPLGRGPAGGTAMRTEWGLFRGSRCCPECVVAGAGTWRLWWRLGGAAACPEHRVLLHGRCPRCGQPLRWGGNWVARDPFPADGLSACMNRPGGVVCGFPLAELPARPVPAGVLEVQDLYLRAAAGRMVGLAGKEVTAAGWFAEMSQLAGLARRSGPREFPGLDALPGCCLQAWRDDHAAGEGARVWQWRACPPSAELTAALLHALAPVLGAGSEPEFRDAASWLISAVYGRSREGFRYPVQPTLLPPFTRRAFMTSQHRGSQRVFLGKFLHPEPGLVRRGLTPAHIPCYANRDDVLDQVTPHLVPKTSVTPGGWRQRRLAALCLVMMVSAVPTWDEAAEMLGLPPLLAANSDPAGYLRIADLLTFREGLIVLGNRLVERGLVDYRARRAALAGLAGLPAADWAGRPGRRGPERYDRGRVFAAAWIWSELTEGRYRESPAWAAHPELSGPAMPKGSSGLYSSWQRAMGPARRDWLRSWGVRYLEEHGCPVPPR